MRQLAIGAARLAQETNRLRVDDRYESRIEGPDGLSFESFRNKRLGAVILTGAHQIGFSGTDLRSGFAWQETDVAMGLIVQLGFKSRYTPEKIKHSFLNLARYITYNGLDHDDKVKLIGGITHRPFAIAAKRFDFHTAPVTYNADIDPKKIMTEDAADTYSHYELATAYRVQCALETYDRLGLGKGRPPQARQTLFAYMPTEEFLDQYGDAQTRAWSQDPPELHTPGPFNDYGHPLR